MPWNSLNATMTRHKGGIVPDVLLGPGGFQSAAAAGEYMQQGLHYLAARYGGEALLLAEAWDNRTEDKVWVGNVLLTIYQYENDVERGFIITAIAAEFYEKGRVDLINPDDDAALIPFLLQYPDTALRLRRLTAAYLTRG